MAGGLDCWSTYITGGVIEVWTNGYSRALTANDQPTMLRNPGPGRVYENARDVLGNLLCSPGAQIPRILRDL